MVKAQTKRLVDELKLNKDQEAKITAIYKKSANNTTDFQKMRDASEAERTKMRETMQKTRDQQEKDIKAVLTPEQVKTYEASLKNRQNGQGGRMGGFGGQNMDPAEMLKMQTQRLVEQYKLNKDQEAKVTAINKKYSQNQTDFSRMRDASDEERTKMRDAMQKVQAEKNKEIRAVLTADQAKLFDENQKKQEEQRRNGQGRMGGFGGPQ
jgi:Spy/CpxP family protein refolding chaperone